MEAWFIFGLLSLFVLAGSEFSQKISLTQKITISAVTNNFFVWILQGIFGLTLAVSFNQLNFPFSAVINIKLIFVAITYFLAGTFYYTSFKGNSPSLSIVLGSISIVVSTILGIIIFNENVILQKFIGITLIILAIWMVNYKLKYKFNKYNLFALVGGSLYGIAFTLDKSFAIESAPMLYVALLSFSVATASLILKGRHIYNEAKHFKKRNYFPMISAAGFGTLFNFFTFTSYSKGGHVGIVDAMNNSAIFIVILLEVVILKDSSDLLKKIMSSISVLIGIVLLSNVS